MTSQRATNDESATSQRYTVHEAALLLGLSVDAVRKRADRGRLKKEKAADGTVYIILDTPDETSQAETPTGQRTSHHMPDAEPSTRQLVDSLQDQVEYLRGELDIRNEELRRKDHLLAAALERIPAIEAPTEDPAVPRESTVTASEDTSKGDVPTDSGEAKIRQSWWQRWFGG